MTCLYLHFLLPDLLNLSILSLVSAIILISPVITRMLSSNGELSNRQQCFPNRIISCRKVWDGRYSCWASGRLWLQHWAALGDTWAGTALVHGLMFSLLCVASTLPSQETLSTVCLTIHFMRDSSMSSLCLLGWVTVHGGNVSELIILLQSDHLTYTSSTK